MKLRTPRATKVLGSLGLLVLLAASWLLVLGPETAELSETRAQIQETRDQNDALRLELAALQRQADQLGQVRRRAAALAGMFPPTADQPGLFKAINAAAVDAGIGPDGVTTLAPNPPVIGADPAAGVQPVAPAEGEQLARQLVTVSLEGSYDQTQRLLANLEGMGRAYLITSVSLSGGAAEGYSTTVTGEMFVMAPPPDPADVAPPGTTPAG